MNTLPVPKGDSDAFVDALVAYEEANRPASITPDIVRLNGNDGGFSLRKYNQETNATDSVPFGDAFKGTILVTRYFVRWKYKEDAEVLISSDEFSSFVEPVNLVSYTKSTKEKTFKLYEDYISFKEAVGMKDEVMGEVEMPFDLWLSLYVYLHEEKKIVNYQFRGTTRGNYFEYMKHYKDNIEPEPRHKIQILTAFGQNKEHNDKLNKDYFSGSFTSEKVLEKLDMDQVMRSFTWLAKWLGGDTQSIDTTEEPITPTSAKDTIKNLLSKLGHEPKTEEEAKVLIKTLTEQEWTPESEQIIIERLEIRVQEIASLPF